jgi:hypothetical protein
MKYLFVLLLLCLSIMTAVSQKNFQVVDKVIVYLSDADTARYTYTYNENWNPPSYVV